MKFSIVICIFLVAFAAFSYASPAKGSTKASLKKKPCLKDCGDVYEPICAGDGSPEKPKSFGSECVMSNYNCENSANLKVLHKDKCPGSDGIRLQ